MTERKMYRYVVPIDDKAHPIPLNGDPVAVAAAPGACVEFWAEHAVPHGALHERLFQVFGTGQPLPENAQWIGTCARTPGGLVWHLYEVAS